MGTNLLVGYTGAYQDPVIGGYPLGNGYRMYLPELMRFNSPDSWSPFGKGGIHPYAYCEADPINRADPSGHIGGLGILGVLSTLVDVVVAEEEAANVAADGGLAAASAARAGSATRGAAERGAETSGAGGASAEQPISGTTVVYRYDKHPPEIVSRDGFTGSTPYSEELSPIFEAYARNTIFAAKTPEGSANYLFGDVPNRYYTATELRPTVRTAYLYRIDISGLDSISLVDGFKNAGEQFRDHLVRHVFSDPSFGWSKWLYPPTLDSISNTVYTLMEKNTIDTYISNQEVHVRGPIAGNRITHISTYHLPEKVPDFWYRF